MSALTRLLGQWGVVGAVGIIFFLVVAKYSDSIFEWFEKQTIGTKTYVEEKLESLFIDIDERKVTYILLACSFGLGVFVMAIFFLMGAWIAGVVSGLIFTIIGLRIPRMVVNSLMEKRIKAYQNQMVDGLQLLSNGIRAGLSVPQAIGMVVDELDPPLSQEFGIILQQNRIGVPLDECLEELVKRVPTQDNQMFVSSINILRESGGNLAEVFDTIVFVIRERIRLQQKVDTYTAQGKFQGFTIACMPFAVGAIFASNDPQMMIDFVSTPIGIILYVAAILLDLAGLFVILKIVKIKI